MTYQWKVPYVLDDRRIREAFGVAATPTEVAVAATAAWMRGELGSPATVEAVHEREPGSDPARKPGSDAGSITPTTVRARG